MLRFYYLYRAYHVTQIVSRKEINRSLIDQRPRRIDSWTDWAIAYPNASDKARLLRQSSFGALNECSARLVTRDDRSWVISRATWPRTVSDCFSFLAGRFRRMQRARAHIRSLPDVISDRVNAEFPQRAQNTYSIYAQEQLAWCKSSVPRVDIHTLSKWKNGHGIFFPLFGLGAQSVFRIFSLFHNARTRRGFAPLYPFWPLDARRCNLLKPIRFRQSICQAL